MTDPWSLAPQGALEWARLVAGAALFLAPGLAAADRFLGLRQRGWMFAPVFSFSLLPLGAIVLDLALQVPITPGVTAGLAVFWTGILLLPRFRQLPALWRHLITAPQIFPRIAWRTAWRPAIHALGVGLVLALVAGLHYLPHLPGDAPGNPLEAFGELAQRWTGNGAPETPYPVHVDEHYHLARQAQLDREESIGYVDPYTGEPSGAPLFSVTGFREERGFQLALVQLHHLTGASFALQARVVPALQSALLAGVVYATLRPAPGALVSAGLVGLIPTTVRFLGPGFLVPSAFALPCIFAALHVSLRAEGGRRLAALAILETAAMFLHLVPGTLTLVAAALGALLRGGRRSDRLALLLAGFLPLLWILPLVVQQVVDAVGSEHDLPFQPAILFSAGWPFLVAAVIGTGLAFALPRTTLQPHKATAWLAIGIAVSLLVSLRLQHHNDATYSRLIPTFFVCLAILAGLAIGEGGQAVRRALRWRPGWIAVATAIVAVALAAPGVQSTLETPYYRVFNDATWDDGRILAEAGASAEDRFLSEPWRAPIYNAWTGAQPVSVLIPGRTPVGAAEWSYYLSSGGGTAEWLAERDITYVVAPVAPNAPHERLGGNVYRILEAP